MDDKILDEIDELGLYSIYEDTIKCEYSNGMTGGNCYGDEPQHFYEDEVDFTKLFDVICIHYPDIKYRTVMDFLNTCVENTEYEEHGYYGNRSTTYTKTIKISDLDKMIEEI